jgi:hypothetical protein
LASSSPLASVMTVEKSFASAITGSPEVRTIVWPISSAIEYSFCAKISVVTRSRTSVWGGAVVAISSSPLAQAWAGAASSARSAIGTDRSSRR